MIEAANKPNFNKTIHELFHVMIKKCLRVVLHVFWVFPIHPDRVSLINEQSFLYGDNVKYLNEYIRENLNEVYEVVFPIREGAEHAPNAIYVKPKSLEYFKYLLTSRAVISNCGGLSYLPKRRGQIFINTWHGGGAYKKVGIDVWNTRCKQIEERMNSSNTNYLCCSCEAFAKYEAPPMFFKPEQCVMTGMPRNDIFFKDSGEVKKKVYEMLGLKENEKLVIYAPTYRSNTDSFAYAKVAREIDLDVIGVLRALGEKGGKWRLGIRMHPRVEKVAFSHASIINCSTYPDMQELMCACDVMITDYSSLMWDFSLTQKPCFLYAPDIDDYERQRGFYTPVSDWPFPIARTNEELINNIRLFSYESYKKKVSEHHIALGSYEKGLACQKVIALFNAGKDNLHWS